jgi:flagellar basal-body rod modification protein FlgD
MAVENTKSSSLLASSGSSANNATTSEEIQNRFLTLLVAQLENQDPLNPLENTEITSQLAQMNTVNGIEQLNVTLNSLVESLADSQAIQASSLINKTVLVPGSHLTLSDGDAFAGVHLSSPADTVTVSIYDTAGNLVQTQPVGASEGGHLLFSWDGKMSDGTDAPNGAYSFKVTASNGGVPVTANALQLGMVSALTRMANGNFVLDLGYLGQYDFADVQQVF